MTDKLTPVTDKVFCCRSGSAAATQAIADVAKYHLNFHRYNVTSLYLQLNSDILRIEEGHMKGSQNKNYGIFCFLNL